MMLESDLFPLHRPELREALKRGDARLSAAMRPHARPVPAGTVLIRQDEPHGHVYRAETGWLARSRQLSDGVRRLVMIFLPNDLFAVKCMFLAHQPDEVVALTDVTLSSIDQQAAHELAAGDPDIALRLAFQLGEEERRLHGWTLALARPAVERLGYMLLELRARLDLAGVVAGNRFRLPMTQEQIGDRTGLSLIHVNRVLRILRERGLVTISRGMVEIHDLAGLRELVLPQLDIFEREHPAFGARPR